MNTKEEEKVNLHAGHRMRMRAQIKKMGLFNLSDVHFLEYLLTFVNKRSDTNPIAHALLNEFGSIKNIFNASTYALTKVKGVGEQTANFLQYMAVVAHMYSKVGNKETTVLNTTRKIAEFLSRIFPPSDVEQFAVLVLNKNNTLKDYKVFNGTSHSHMSINSNELTDYLITHKANFIVFAHTHPHSSAQPSLSDIHTFSKLEPLINALSISIVDNIVIGDTNYYSLKHATMYEKQPNDNW